MKILTIRTDNPTAEVGLYDDNKQLAYEKWQAHRQLGETIHNKIQAILNLHGLTLKQIDGLVVYGGAGSFTGLRIGGSVANALAYGLKIPIVSVSGDEKSWIDSGISRLLHGETDKIVIPNYGAPALTTKPRK